VLGILGEFHLGTNASIYIQTGVAIIFSGGALFFLNKVDDLSPFYSRRFQYTGSNTTELTTPAKKFPLK